MSILDRLDRLAPRFAFARHIPPKRLYMRVLRRLQIALGLSKLVPTVGVQPKLRNTLPQPIFPLRKRSCFREGNQWEFTFLGRKRVYANRVGWTSEPNQLWRMNLHYMEYLEHMSAEDGLDLMLDWIEANPAGRSNAHLDAWNAYALSLRIVSWIHWLALHQAALEKRSLDTILGSLSQQLDWLARFPETDIGGNHLIKNIKALIYGSACISGLQSARWLNRGTRLLKSELDIQILADGFHFELSPSYHCQVTADLLEVYSAGNQAIREVLRPFLSRMVVAIQNVTHPDGNVAQFNDSGLNMAYRPAELEKAWLDIISDGSKALPHPAVTDADGGILANAGIASLKSDGFTIFVKYGEPGARTLPAHAHGDIGTIEVSCGKRRMIVDQGVFEYVKGDRRDKSRSGRAHNVTAPAEGECADFFGEFRCGWWPEPTIHQAEYSQAALKIDVEHNGYQSPRGNPCYSLRREISACADEIEIFDRLSQRSAVNWSTGFLIHPAWKIERVCDGLEITDGDQIVRVFADMKIDIVDDEWWPDMGVTIACKRLLIVWPDDIQNMRTKFIRVRKPTHETS